MVFFSFVAFFSLVTVSFLNECVLVDKGWKFLTGIPGRLANAL